VNDASEDGDFPRSRPAYESAGNNAQRALCVRHVWLAAPRTLEAVAGGGWPWDDRRLMRLPLFPLHAVVFPHLPLPLHIFEERYRAMTADLLRDGSPYAGRFVVAMITSGQEAGDRAPATHSLGTVCEVRRAERFADGRWALVAVGVARARLLEVDRSGSYAVAEVEQLAEPPGDAPPGILRRAQLALDEYLASVKRFVVRSASSGERPTEPGTMAATLDTLLKPIHLPDDPVAASYAVAGVLQVELARKQQLLEAPDAATRLHDALHMLGRETALLDDSALPPVITARLPVSPN
jgi:Lon protease-like protein